MSVAQSGCLLVGLLKLVCEKLTLQEFKTTGLPFIVINVTVVAVVTVGKEVSARIVVEVRTHRYKLNCEKKIHTIQKSLLLFPYIKIKKIKKIKNISASLDQICRISQVKS